MFIKFAQVPAALGDGKQVRNASYRNDGSEWVAESDEALLGAEVLSEEQYIAAVAANEAYNEANPDTPPEPTPAPNIGNFRLAVFADAPVGVGKQKARALARDYPDSQVGLDQGNWAVVRGALADMLADAAVTQEEHDRIESLMAQFNIPEA